MDNELSEIYAFIGSIAPFEHIDEPTIIQLVKCIDICYLVQGNQLPPKSFDGPNFYIVRKGALNYLDNDGELIGKYGEGDICTVFSYPEKYPGIQVTTDEDCLLYAINKQKLLGCLIRHADIISFFELSAAARLKRRVSQLQERAIISSSLTNTAIDQLYHSPAATINVKKSIKAAAQKMTDLNFSCLVVIDDNQQVAGIVTDKDFRRRCIAQTIPRHSPIELIMTREVTTLDIRQTAFDALITMSSQHIHHLPITDQGKLAGMLTITDLMHFEGQNTTNLTSKIHKASSVDELVVISTLLPKLQIRLAKLGTTGEQVGKTISAITMAFTIRLIEMAEQLFGEAPVPYAWLAAGSQARQEQLAHSDQDNALIISDAVLPEHELWFETLANFVCDGLDKCGFIYCPGEVMATNSKWRQPARVWQNYFTRWIETPDPKALMNASIFFDLTTIYGNKSLLNTVKENMLKRTQQSSLFIAHMSKNALQHKPPLGFFRDFVLISNGKNKRTMDLKHNGIAPIVDLARIYALQEGIAAVNTVERLSQAAGTRSLAKASAANLIDAFEFLSTLRLTHQANQLTQNKQGKVADNYLAPKEISRLEREHLKDAFKVIKTMQDNRQAVF